MAAVKAAQYVILGVWAYGESIVELKQLYRGGSIEPVKTRQNWKLSLQELLSMDLNQEYSDEKGLSYEEYLKMLFLLQNEQKILPDNVSHGNQNDRTGKYGLSPEKLYLRCTKQGGF